jgi:catechol 2,3-dioxygenase-like lactoylglutathione lyase family enzyme
MHVIGLDRVMIATRDMEETTSQFSELLGLEFSETMEPTTDTDTGSQMVQNVISAAGVELVAPRGEGDNEVSRFIEENGPGLYALSIRVGDLEEAREELAEKGVHPVGRFDHADFSEDFYHPSNFGGAFVILAEYDAPHPAVTASNPDSA